MVYSKFLSDYLETEYRADKEETGMRADSFLAAHVGFFSRTRLKQKIQAGESLLNGRRHSASKRVREGDVFTVTWRKQDDRVPAPMSEILYEDEWLLAVMKPAGMAVHPTGRKQSGTLIQGIHEYFKENILESLQRDDSDFYPRLINRLDLFTSGIVLVAKHKEAFVAMQELQIRKEYDKRYLTLVEGRLEPEEGSFDWPLAKDEQSEIYVKQTVREDGLASVTHYHVREYLDGHTLAEARPVSGRQHQIRVHFARAGHPVWGDLIYKDEALFMKYLENDFNLEGLPPRHALHAERMGFVHPFTGERLEIRAAVPEGLKAIIETIRKDTNG
ncbi:RluA family pseudouridine synthase [Planctomycetota bacterium]